MNIPWEAIEGLVVYIIASTIGFVWWMATITEQIKTLSKLVEKMSQADGLYARKEDVARELGVLENRQQTMWDKYDKLKEKVDGFK